MAPAPAGAMAKTLILLFLNREAGLIMAAKINKKWIWFRWPGKITLFLLLLSFNVSAENPITGKISILHTNSVSNSNTLARGYSELQLLNKSFDAPCGWLFIKPEDNNVLSLLLSAQAQNREVKIYYIPSASSPWAPGSCALSGVQIVSS
jgi:hypothetical protein